MTTITTPLERDQAGARLDRLGLLSRYVAAIVDAADHPRGDPLLMDQGRYAAAVLQEFADDLDNELLLLAQAIAAWDASWKGASK